MPRFAKARDANEKDIVKALIDAGWSVERIEPVGRNNGTPDLVIAKDGWEIMAEVKRPAGPRGGTKDKRLTPKQETWHDEWKGPRPLILDSADNAENVARAERWLARMEGYRPTAELT